MSTPTTENIFLNKPMLPLLLKTAAPIMLVMIVNGMFTVIDAYFLGRFTGYHAVVAVTLMFPLYMMLVALSTLVSSGFASIYARALGATDHHKSRDVSASAIYLSIVVCVMLIILFIVIGKSSALLLTEGSERLAVLGHGYLSILVWCSPVMFLLGLNTDALRVEGKLPHMTFVMLLAAGLNIFLDWLFIVEFKWGVDGSAYATVLAQVIALMFALSFRRDFMKNALRFSRSGVCYWSEILALGAPTALGYFGVSFATALTIWMIQVWSGEQFESISGAYGIINRLQILAFLPLLGLSLALQSIVGNTYGAGQFKRTSTAIKYALIISIFYSFVVQTSLFTMADSIGSFFVNDHAIQLEVARILPIVSLSLFLFGIIVIVSTYFQAIGDKARAAITGLSRTWFFAIPLCVLMPFMFGESGIWWSGVVADICAAFLCWFIYLGTPSRQPIA